MTPAGPVVASRTALRRCGALAVVAGVLAVSLAQLALPWRPATLCFLRALTGVPCPFCGGTTALVSLGRGDLRAAAIASPLALLALALGALQPLLRRWQARMPRSAVLTAVAVVLGLAEVWQLGRAGLLG